MSLAISISPPDGASLRGADRPYRSSPIYSVTATPELPADGSDFAVGLFEFRYPAQSIARITARAPELAKHLWFSLGNCCCIVMAPDAAIVREIKTVAGDESLASEIWTVSGGRIVSTVIDNYLLSDIDPKKYVVHGAEKLDVELRALIEEFSATVDAAVSSGRIHAPFELGTYGELVKVVQSIVADLVYLRDPAGRPLPPGLSASDPATLEADNGRRNSLRNQRIDQLVQLNSTLSYVTSQAVFGAVPVLASASVVRRYSLLGIGSAHRALVMVARSIEMALQVNSVERVVREAFPNGAALPCFEHPVAWDPTEWNATCGVDRYFSTSEYKSKSLPKLPYFSGRLGFRETQFSISSAMQVLFAGDGREWSLGTMTHEMMHAHVRNIFGAIFQRRPTETEAQMYERIYAKFAEHMRGTLGKKTLSTIDCVRHVILSYCCLAERMGSLTRLPERKALPEGATVIRDELVLLPLPYLKSQLEHEFRNLNELFVLVLDFHYFYKSELPLYLQAVWQSWAAVPGVLRDIRQYALRSLLSAASLADSVGDLNQRFRSAVAEVQDALRPVASEGPDVGLIKRVLDEFDTPAKTNTYMRPFVACLRVVDLAKHVFYSAKIRGTLFRGDIITDGTLATEDESLAPGVFADLPLPTPLPLIGERVAASLSSVSGPELEYASAWLLLCCSSSQHDDRGGEDGLRGD